MFYKFNQLTQNLVSTTHDIAVGRTITPQSCKATISDSPAIHYEYKPLQVQVERQASSSASLQAGPGKYPVPNTKGYKKLMDLQTKFTAHDGKLVWQKLPMDKPLYTLTVGLVVVSVALSVVGLYKLISPPKNE